MFYVTKFANAYIVYDLVEWPNKFSQKFPITTKNNDKSKWKYHGYGIAFNGAGLSHFGDVFARNVIMFGVDENSSSPHTNNHKKEFSVLDDLRY